MPTQIFIIPPKAPRARKPLGASISDTVQKPESQSEPHTPINEQTKSSSENKLVPPSMRINPPQLILDSLSDWEDEDRRFGHRLTLIPRQRRKYRNHYLVFKCKRFSFKC
jgi:hypothetical protein